MGYFSRNQIQDENMAEYIKQKLKLIYSKRAKTKGSLNPLTPWSD